MITRGLLIALAVSLVLETTSYAQSNRLGTSLPTQRQLGKYGLERAWWSQATINPSRESVEHVSHDEDMIYVLTTGGTITGIDAETGKRLWAHQLGRRDQPNFAPVSNGDEVLVVTGLDLYSIEKYSGDILWQIRLPKQPSTGPAADERQVYIGTLDGSVFALNLPKIKELFEENLLPQFSADAVSWRYKTGREITTPPITTGLVVNFSSLDGSLYSVETFRRKLRWQLETDKPIAAPLAQSGDSIFMASQDSNLYCVGAENGTKRWYYVVGYPVRKAPKIVGDRVFVVAEGAGMYCLSKGFGIERWFRPALTEFLAASTTRFFASDNVGNVVLVSQEDGAILGQLPLRGFSKRVSNDRTDRLYLATPRGLVVCIREKGQEFPIYHMYPERQPILPLFAPDKPEPEPEPAK